MMPSVVARLVTGEIGFTGGAGATARGVVPPPNSAPIYPNPSGFWSSFKSDRFNLPEFASDDLRRFFLRTPPTCTFRAVPTGEIFFGGGGGVGIFGALNIFVTDFTALKIFL